MTQANSAIDSGNSIALKKLPRICSPQQLLQSMEGWSTKPTFPLYYFQMKMRQDSQVNLEIV